MVEALRMVQKARLTAVAAWRVALQMIRADIISAPEELHDQLRGMTRMQLIRHLVATRPDSTDFRTPLGAAKIALKRLAKRYVDLDDEVSELDDMIDAILAKPNGRSVYSVFPSRLGQRGTALLGARPLFEPRHQVEVAERHVLHAVDVQQLRCIPPSIALKARGRREAECAAGLGGVPSRAVYTRRDSSATPPRSSS